MRAMSCGKMASKALRGLLLAVAAVILPVTLFGQNAVFTGRVTDASGAVIPKAQITVHNQQTGVDIKTQTTGTGNYTVPYLTPGHYSIRVAAPGFKDANRINIGLQGSQTAVINFRLQVGAATQTVTVNGNEVMMDRGKADRGEVVEDVRITELPTFGRDPVMLDRLNSAVIWDGNLIWQRPFDGQTFTNLHINGSDPGGGANYSSEIMVDGISDQTPMPQDRGHTDVGYVVPEDSVQDFKVITTPYDAQYGRMRGGVIDMDLKTGTNKIHGDAYETARRTWLDANWWLNDANKILNPQKVASGIYNTPQHKLDQYGFELDGPVVLPKIYNGHDKTFFVIQFENWNEIEPNTVSSTSVPLPAWSSGDFSGLTYNGQQVQLYNPYSTYTDSLGRVHREPFPNNKIPQGMLNPTAVALMKFYPAPNQPGLPGTPWQQNFYNPNNTTDIYRNALIKLDHTFGPRDRFTLRYGYWERYETDVSNQITTGPAAFGEWPLGDRNHTFATEYTHTFTPNLLFDFRADSTVKAELAFTGPTGYNDTTLGWPSSMVSQLGGFTQFPGIGAGGFTGLGATGHGNGYTVTDSLNLLPTVTWIKGKHTFRTGIDMRFYRYAIPQNVNTKVGLSFNSGWTQDCWSCGLGNDWNPNGPGTINVSNLQGNSIASMLLGLASGGSDSIASTAYYSAPYYAPYFQDDWKATPKLTLNLGLRYDLQPYYVERHNRANYAFDTTTMNPVDAMLATHTLTTGVTFTDKGGITFLGVNGNPRRPYATNKLDFGPRIGFAYAVNDRFVLRGGFGEYYQNSDAFPILNGYSSNTSYVNSPDGGLTPVNWNTSTGCCFGGNLGHPFPTVAQPTGSSLGLLTNMGNGQSYLNPHFMLPNVWQFSLGWEMQLSRNDLLDLSFVGNRAPNNETSQNINHWAASAMAKCNAQMGGAQSVCNGVYSKDPKAIYGYVPNPYYHIAAFQGSGLYSQSTRQALNWTQPMPEFGGVTEWQWNGARSWYNSLQATFQHRFSRGLTVHATWTWSKFMDAGGWADNNYLIPARHIDGSDRPQNITMSVVYDLPVGRGRTFLSNANRIVDGAIGGWEFAGMSIIQSGWPLGVPGGWQYVHNAKIKPYWTPQHNIQNYAPCYWTIDSETGQLTESAEAKQFGCTQPDFIQIPAYGANLNTIFTGIRQPWGIFEDSNLSKYFKIAEGMQLQLRLETFNTFNHPLFQNCCYAGITQYPGQTGATTGGGQSNKPRYTQLGLKLMW